MNVPGVQCSDTVRLVMREIEFTAVHNGTDEANIRSMVQALHDVVVAGPRRQIEFAVKSMVLGIFSRVIDRAAAHEGEFMAEVTVSKAIALKTAALLIEKHCANDDRYWGRDSFVLLFQDDDLKAQMRVLLDKLGTMEGWAGHFPRLVIYRAQENTALPLGEAMRFDLY
ncbi:hypothetical protein LTR53_008938 [Teratosphaeriaceae sp. CCFEE 6253]|nr:hypothetical protein LTR53_008938 [Teratosphaeriaceae sp. CCFEE 6253]